MCVCVCVCGGIHAARANRSRREEMVDGGEAHLNCLDGKISEFLNRKVGQFEP